MLTEVTDVDLCILTRPLIVVVGGGSSVVAGGGVQTVHRFTVEGCLFAVTPVDL